MAPGGGGAGPSNRRAASGPVAALVNQLMSHGHLRQGLAVASFLLFLLVTPALANPANNFLSVPMDPYAYDYAKGCNAEMPRGMRKLRNWLEANVRGETWNIYRCDRLGNGWSVHAESRAIDWRLNVRNAREKRAADRLVEKLLARDNEGKNHALARRMGVQGIIWNCRSWWATDRGDDLSRYYQCQNGNNPGFTQAHKDHIHLEMHKVGARAETSFWRFPRLQSR